MGEITGGVVTLGIAHYFRRSREGYLNIVELNYDEKKGCYIRKRFNSSFIADCYSSLITFLEAIPNGLRPKSGKSRKHTEAKRYKEFNSRGFQVPKLLEEGDDYLDIEYVEMRELSRLLRDTSESKRKNLELIKLAASEMRKIHDAGFVLGDPNVHNIAATPDGRIMFFDFEHQFIRGGREKDYSTLARSAALEVPDPADVKGILRAIALGYGEDLTQRITIVPFAYFLFLGENKLKNLLELIRAKRHGIRV